MKKLNVFKKYFTFEGSRKESEILEVQKSFQKGEIGQGDLSEDTIDRLIELYDSQITELTKSIEKCNKRIGNLNIKVG